MWNADRIKKLRKRYGETQDVFSKRLNVSPWTLRDWEQSKGEPIGPAEFLLDRLEEDLIADRIRPLPGLPSLSPADSHAAAS